MILRVLLQPNTCRNQIAEAFSYIMSYRMGKMGHPEDRKLPKTEPVVVKYRHITGIGHRFYAPASYQRYYKHQLLAYLVGRTPLLHFEPLFRVFEPPQGPEEGEIGPDVTSDQGPATF